MTRKTAIFQISQIGQMSEDLGNKATFFLDAETVEVGSYHVKLITHDMYFAARRSGTAKIYCGF
jgi:hypothetical protein